ncbi:hypothetical protein MMC13_003126 [Lambiella insularis]|nr:hypothetical protein [Lambiella insularis]
MPLISSPIAYPPSSSPPEPAETRKRPQPPDFASRPAKRKLFGRSLAESDGIKNKIVPKVVLLPSAAASTLISGVQPLEPFVEDEGEQAGVSGRTSPITDALDIPRLPILPTANGKDGQKDQHIGDTPHRHPIKLTSGKTFSIRRKECQPLLSYEQLIARRSVTSPGRAQTSYYGIEMHKLMDEAAMIASSKKTSTLSLPPVAPLPSIETGPVRRRHKSMMWTEKYRAKKFTDLVGDERTHRTVLRWIKGWDTIVFPGVSKPRIKSKVPDDSPEERPHRKILLLTGPPGFGKTTLAHVCAKQAGYEVVEINASDERSSQVVKGRIRDSVGTENVRGVNTITLDGTVRKAGRPVCVVIDEVDGVVGGSSGGGEGGFIKALIDLVVLDQKNTTPSTLGVSSIRKKRKGDQFRLLRPMILICNDVYHPALRPLRASGLAEIIHIRKPPLDKVVARMKTIFDKEGIANDGDGIRRLCEATWGISNRKDSRANSSHTGEGDIRGVLVVGEWVAGKIRATTTEASFRLTRQWVEKHMLDDLSHAGGGARCIGRGGAKEAADRVFLDGAGFPKTVTALPPQTSTFIGSAPVVGVADLNKSVAMSRLRDIIDTSGEPDRIMTDVFTAYPSQPFQDDTFLSKPNAAYEWLHFHDTISSKVFTGQEWELTPYLSQSILSFHYLFASSATHSSSSTDPKPWAADDDPEPAPFSGPRADHTVFETTKQNRALLLALQSSLSAPLLRSFRSPEEVATDLLPHAIRMLAPDIKPVIVGGSGNSRGTASVRKDRERAMVARAVEAMGALGVTFERARVEDARGAYGAWIYRMEPALDTLAAFETSSRKAAAAAPARYAVRQVLEQEYQEYVLRQRADARQARFRSGGVDGMERRGGVEGKENAAKGAPGGRVQLKMKGTGVKRDFFGRVIVNEARSETREEGREKSRRKTVEENRIWVSYNEGFSNAVRKPVSLAEVMRGL